MQRDKILVAVALVGVVFAGSWMFLVKPKREDARQLDQQIAAARSDLAGASARAAQYTAARDRLRKHPEAFEKSARALPNRVSMPEILRTLTKTARGTGVTMGELTTGGDSSGAATTPGISGVSLQMNFSGDFLALRRYLERLQRFVNVSKDDVAARGRLVALNTVSLKPVDNALTAQVSATVYTLQPGALTTSAPASTAGTAGAAATPAPASGAPATSPSTGAPAPAASTSTPAGGA